MTPQEILATEGLIVDALRTVYDPEIPVNIYDLGLIYSVEFLPGGEAIIRMTLTAPNCPMADQLLEDTNRAVMGVAGVESVDVVLTFDPPWDRSMMSEAALLELGML